MPISDLERFKDILFILRENGFEVARFERRGFMSIIRNGEYIDIYFFTPYAEDRRLSTCICELCEVKYINNTMQMEFQGELYTVPKESEALLDFLYGNNWRTPISMFNFKMNKLDRIKAFTIQYIKALLPHMVTETIQDIKSKKRIAFFKQKAYATLNK
ncbi:lysis protein [Prevotella nigrescens]|uniref:lysis protein n=1 Tax=Prevotella nigrescens TaxID=28133 RepID=UPI00288BD172|nr:lysis protein [Prevotella nigrescens]